jgi:lipooligosaccharide transport system permease protein
VTAVPPKGSGAGPGPMVAGPTGRVLPAGLARRRPLRIVERNVLAYRRVWFVFLPGFFEPFLYLLSIGIGVGALVGDVELAGGRTVPYEVFVAPGLLAAAAMNGAVFDTTFNFFVKFKYSKTYDAVLATPLGVHDVARGEVLWALGRGGLYSVAFLLAMVALGHVQSWWAVLAAPGAVLIGLAFAGAGLAATTWMRSFVDFDYVNLAIVPMFLFSATFFPLERYPDAVGWVVRMTPLYQGVALERALVLGDVGWGLLVHVAYLAALGLAGMALAGRRLERLLQP